MQIGNYTVIRPLGGGGMGVVFRVADQAGHPFAIKMIGSRSVIQATLHIDKALQNTAALDFTNVRMQFVREARLAMDLNHPNIVKTFDYGQQGGLLYIVAEYLRGRSLDKVIPIHGAVPLSAKVRIIRQICDALDYAHRQGVMHRDIKPANTFVLQDGDVLRFWISDSPFAYVNLYLGSSLSSEPRITWLRKLSPRPLSTMRESISGQPVSRCTNC